MRKAALFLFAAAAAVLSVSCNKDDKTSTQFTPLSETTFNVDMAGGSFEFLYDIKNPTNDAVTAEVQEGVDWITELDAHSAFGKVTFDVLANEEETTREASINLSYGTLSIELKVIQGEGGEIPAYRITMKEVDYMSATWDIIAKDQEMPYINMLVDKTTWDSFDSFDEYFNYSLLTIEERANSAGLTLADYIEQSLLIYGDTLNVSAKGMLPATDYVVYAIGLTPELEKLSEVAYEAFTTKDMPMVDVDFTIEYTDVTSTTVMMSVTPDDNEVYYMFSTAEGSDYTPEQIRESYQVYINGLIDEMLALGGINLPIEDIIKPLSSIGPDSYLVDELAPSTVYTGFAMAVDLYTGIFNSVPVLKTFTTEELVGEWKSTLTEDRELDLDGAVMTAEFHPNYFGNGYNNWELDIKPSDGVSGDEIKIDIIVDTEGVEDGIPSGKYSVAADSPDNRDPLPGEFIAGEYYFGYIYTWFKGDFGADGKPQSVAPATGGTLEITNNGNGNYTIEFRFIDDSPLANEFYGTWTGDMVLSE